MDSSQFVDDEAEEVAEEGLVFDREEEDDIGDIQEWSGEEAGSPVQTEFQTAHNYALQNKPWLKRPDVLGYLNSFKDLDDHDRARLCRGVANYLQNSMNTRNGVYRRRAESRGTRMVSATATAKRQWKKSKKEEEV